MSLDIDLVVDDEIVWTGNITHNLNEMADAAGIYWALWRPETQGYEIAADIVYELETGLAYLEAYSDYFRLLFNPENGWGTYSTLVKFTERYLAACKQYPSATIKASR
jgi:hypothetical protein